MTLSTRKQEYSRQALSIGHTMRNGLADSSFVHNSLPNLDVSDVTFTTEIGELTLSSPIFVNAMTGSGRFKTEEMYR